MDANSLNFIGIITSIIGTWLFGWDVIWGARKRNRAIILRVQRQTLNSTYLYVKNINNKLQNYTVEQIQKEHEKNDAEHLPKLKEFDEKIRKHENTAEIAAVLAVFGLIICSAGALCQIAALYYPSKKDINHIAVHRTKSYILKNIQFDYNSETLKNISFKELDSLARVLILSPDRQIEISAYTDDVGSNEFNLKLSNRRANSVKEYLLSKNIDSLRIRIHSFGESNPVAPNITENGRNLNRRVEFRYLN